MVVKAILLFLFGTSVSAGPIASPKPTDIIISKHRHRLHDVEYIPPSGHHPFISNFIQKGTNVFFKPFKLMLSANLPTQVQHIGSTIAKEDCETHFIHEEPLHVIEHEIIEEPPKVEHIVAVSPAPVLPPMEMPSLPILIEETHVNHEIPCDTPALVVEEIKPVITEPQKPLMVEIENPIVVPPAPILPPMEMPHLPVLVEEVHTEHDLPCEPVDLAVEEPKQPIVIPPAPLLPPTKLPELPVMVEESHIVHELPCPPAVVKEFKPFIIAKQPKHVILDVDRPKHFGFSPVTVVHSKPKPILGRESHHVHKLPKASMHLDNIHAITNIHHPVIMDPHPILMSHTEKHMHVAREQTHHKLIPTLAEIYPHWY